MRGAAVFLLAVGLSLPAPGVVYADMYPDASNAKLPEARYNLNLGTAATPLDFDPLCDGSAANAAHDCSAAIATALTVTKNGQAVNVHLPAGRYLVKNPMTITDGRCLFGDSRRNTFLHIDQTFSPAATGIVVLNMVPPVAGDGFAKYTPCVKDLAFEFDQPSTQGVRANFQTLGTCTSGSGGTGCKYPPAIYQPQLLGGLSVAGGMTIRNIRIERAWDGITLMHASSIDIENIEESSLNVGLTLENGHNFGHVSHWVHYGWGIDGTSLLYTGVYEDGNTYAAKIGALDGGMFNDFRTWEGRIELTSTFSWASFTGLALDGNNSVLEINHTAASQPVLITGGYASGASSKGAAGKCQIDIGSAAALVSISNFNFTAAGPGAGGLCVAGGKVNVTGGQLAANGIVGVNLTGGNTTITGMQFTSPDRVFGGAQILATGTATYQLIGNSQVNPATNSQIFASLQVDNALNYIADNQTNGWFISRGFNTNLGYYDVGNQPIAVTMAPTFTTVGNFAAANVVSSGHFSYRGNYVEFTAGVTFDTNAFTTAAGQFLVNTNMPLPLAADNPAGCAWNKLQKVAFPANTNLACAVLNGTLGSMGISGNQIISGAASAPFNSLNVVPSTTGVELRATGRYRVR